MEEQFRISGYVQAGFASPALDYSEDDIDLEKILRPRPSIFYLRAVNDSMIGANIPPGSVLVVDKALSPKNYSIVIASVNGEFLVKYYVRDIKGIRLEAANPKYPALSITEEMGFQVWGVVTAVIILTN